MKKLFLCLLSVGLLLSLASPLWADELFSVKLGYQSLSPSGTFAGTDGGGTEIDMEDDLNFDDSEDFTGEIALNLGNHRLAFIYFPLDVSGSGTNVDFIFNGQQFVGDAEGDLNADIYEVAYTYYLLNFDDLPSRFQFGIEAAIKYADADASMTGSTTQAPGQTITEDVDGSLPFPTLGLRSRVALADFIGIAGRFGYLEYDSNSYLDAEVQIEFSPLPLVGIYGGYRYLEIDVDESDVLIDATFEGPFVGAFARF